MPTTSVSVPIQEADTPEKLLRDIQATLVEMDSEGTRELGSFITAIEAAQEKMQQAMQELDDVVEEIRLVTAENAPDGDASAQSLLEEIEKDEDEDDVL